MQNVRLGTEKLRELSKNNKEEKSWTLVRIASTASMVTAGSRTKRSTPVARRATNTRSIDPLEEGDC